MEVRLDPFPCLKNKNLSRSKGNGLYCINQYYYIYTIGINLLLIQMILFGNIP